jgi:hypothetical protein
MLREDTVYLKFSTTHDLLHDATAVMLLERLHDWNRQPFEFFQDIGVRGRPKPVTAALILEKLHGPVGEGVHQPMRFKLWREKGSPVRSFELIAGAHPYTGTFQTQIDLRIERSWVARNGITAPRVLESQFRAIAALIHPFQGHAHDTDDNSIQNIDNPRLIKRGFGIDVEGPIDLADNPGRELSRGEHRYAVNWLTLFGPGLLSKFPPELVESAPAETIGALAIDPTSRLRPAEKAAQNMGTEPIALRQDPQQWIMIRLGPSPLPAESLRESQRAVRDHLGLRKMAHDERYMLGYWQKKT